MAGERKHLRYRVEWEVEIRTDEWGEVLTLTATSASRGGLFLRSHRPAAVGSIVRVQLRLPAGNWVELTGEVVRCAPENSEEPGFAISFANSSATQLATIEALARKGVPEWGGPEDRHEIRARVTAREVTYESTVVRSIAELLDRVSQEQTAAAAPSATTTPAADTVAVSSAAATPADDSLAEPELAPAGSLLGIEARLQSAAASVTAKATVVDEPPTPDTVPLSPREPQVSGSSYALRRGAIAAENVERRAPQRSSDTTRPPTARPAQAPSAAAPAATAAPAPSAAVAPAPRGAQVLPAGPRAKAVGIDFGTSYSSIAVVCGKEAVVLQDNDGLGLMPTIVSYPEQGEPIVGWAAKALVARAPSTTFVSPKRLLGRRHDDQAVAPYLASTPLRLSPAPDGNIVADIYGDAITIPQVCAVVLRRLVALAETRLGTPVRDVVLSAPVGYQTERGALRRAAQIAGLNVLEIIDEPMGAALTYGAAQLGQGIVAVYDFGGGTFDFTLLEIAGPKFTVIGEAGDPWLGGDDFDLAIANEVANQVWRARKVDLRQRLVEWQTLLLSCEEVKRKLTEAEEATLLARGLLLSIKGPIDVRMPFSRAVFGHLCQELVERSLQTMQTCFELAGVEPSAVNHVVLCGGMARSPLIRDAVQGFFQRDIPLVVNPEEAIVRGAAHFARQLGGT